MRLSIRFKLIAALVIGLGIIAVATAVLMGFVHRQGVEHAALHEVERAAEGLAALEAAEMDRLSSLLETIASDESLADSFQRRDRVALQAEAGKLLEQLRNGHGVTHWYFHPPRLEDGIFLRVHQPELFGDLAARPTLRRAFDTGQEAAGREMGKTAFAVRVVKPWRVGGKLIGFLELGADIPTFLARMHRVTGDRYAMLLDKRPLDRAAWAALTGRPERWDARPELVVVAATDGDETVAEGVGRMADIPDRPAVLDLVRQGGRALARGVFPLRGGDGKTIGAVAVLHEITPLLAGTDALRVRVVILVVLLATGLAALVIFLLESLVFERVERMTRVLEALPERLARGEDQPAEVGPRDDDEIGRFEQFLDRALQAIGSFVAEARQQPPPGPTRRSERDGY